MEALFYLPDRLMAGHQPLKLFILVRLQVGHHYSFFIKDLLFFIVQ